MTAVVVADAGPLIGLARIDRLSVLASLYGSVLVPERVLAELHVDSDRPGARALSAALAQGTIRQQALPEGSATELARLGLLLDAGEASAILLAEQTQPIFSKFCRSPAPKPRFSGTAGRAVHAGSIT